MQMCVCGAANTDEAKFCSKCGKALEPPPPRCRNCNAELLAGAGFCTGCGVAVDDAGTGTPKPKPAPPRESDPHVLAMIGQPIRTLERARLMAGSGALGAAIVAVLGVLLAFSFPAGDRPMRFLVAAFYLACAFGMWRGWFIAALAACALYALDLFVSLKVIGSAAPGSSMEPTHGAALFVLFIVLPAALICGLRGCWAWGKFKREGEPRPPTPAA